MGKKYFRYYEFLEWLDPADYFREDWRYVRESTAYDDDMPYSIVERCCADADAYVEYRYTII